MTRVLGGILVVAALTPAIVGLSAPRAGAAPITSLPATPCVPIVNCDPAASLAKEAAKAAAEASLVALVKWVGDGAVAVLDRIGNEINKSAEPHLDARWFATHFKVMQSLAVLVVMPLLLAALISAVIHQDPGRLVGAVAVHLPLAVLGGFAAVQLTQVALNATDQLCWLVSRGMGNDVPGALVHIGIATQAAAVPTGNLLAGGFLAFVVALMVVLGAVLIWLELLVRSAAIYVAVLFLPLTLAGLVWPATARWAKRLVEILVALILSKFVVVAVISLAVSGLGATKDGLAAGFGGAALLLLAGFAPFVLLRLVPIVEAGVIGHLEGTSRRPAMAAGVTSSQLVRRMVQSAGTGSAAAGPVVAGTAAAPMMVAQAVGTKGFLDGLSGDDATGGSASQGSRAPATAEPIMGERRQPATAHDAGAVLAATGDKGAEREAGSGDRE